MKECFRRRERKQYTERRAAATPMGGLRHMCVEDSQHLAQRPVYHSLLSQSHVLVSLQGQQALGLSYAPKPWTMRVRGKPKEKDV